MARDKLLDIMRTCKSFHDARITGFEFKLDTSENTTMLGILRYYFRQQEYEFKMLYTQGHWNAMAYITALDSIMEPKRRDIITVLCFQGLMLVLFGLFARYGPTSAVDDATYPLFQDVHVMIFIGFGFLMTFLRRYGFSAVGFNFLLAALMIQWALICNGFYDLDDNTKIPLSIVSLLKADIAAAAVLISMGAVLGQTSYVQLLVMGFIEIAVFCANNYLGNEIFKVSDAGASIFVHVMGAYFGLGVSYVLCRNKKGSEVQNSLEGSSYTSDLFAMIGTIFLWMFWPSFNAGELEGDLRHRAVINTYLSLASCCVTAFSVSALLTPGYKFDMVHIQNSTLAGGVAVGTAANMMLQPYGALIVGVVAGTISVFGYSVLTPLIDKKLNIHDTCGVHNLHGMPGVLAGLVGALMAGIATEETYNGVLYEVFPARGPPSKRINDDNITFKPSDLNRSAAEQAGYQILALVVTMAIAIVAGVVTGFIIMSPLMTKIAPQNRYNDALSWHLPENEESNSVQLPERAVVPTNGSSKEQPQSVVSVEEC